ncbi:Eco57I restriction-modification methylase domain-containing protein, partial [Halorhodospira sp. M38]|uniref:Eco57I restriction-modification methylase domain-containing protein n=1 Tax=unclassified Halorhodospira TaxID=2626748 RepID=UPI003FCD839A|nr:hypothetical protein [Halorhodospira sp. M39old]MCG5547071.1 hypothetical protein [Halorhodospira sp. M38]
MAWVGITNENEFYSEHYLSEVFSTDIKAVVDRWQQAEKRSGETGNEEHTEAQRTPWKRLSASASAYNHSLSQLERERRLEPRVEGQRDLVRQLLSIFGYDFNPRRLLSADDSEIPVLAEYRGPDDAPLVWVVQAVPLEETDADPLTVPLREEQYTTLSPTPVPKALYNSHGNLTDWQSALSRFVFAQERPPRWVLLTGPRQWLLIDRTKFAQGRLLRFDWPELFSRQETETLKAASVLLHRESLVGESGSSLLDTLEESAHKHAYGVSEDLKYALREAIELLGNEAARQLIDKARQRKEGIYSGEDRLDPEQLSRECLRYMYRLLFLFYIEARPDLGYAPIGDATYYQGYSLESLRELEMVPLQTEREQRGRFLHDSLEILFRLVREGYYPDGDLFRAENTQGEAFSMAALPSHLFDPERTPYLQQVVFPNDLLQHIIRLMSLSRPGRGRRRRGRISYAQLGINQLGAVYEALLAYRGFFASEDLYEVKSAKAGNPDPLDTGYFVSAAELERYREEERVYDRDEQGHLTLRRHPRGTFLYRLAGRDREKTASYYTPEVLTRSLVKYALKELKREQLDPLPDDAARAERVLELTICEPAMGSAAFLNEAVDQLADLYLELAQSASGERISQADYGAEKQRVKLYLANHNVFGVDLNPVAVELAEVSLWLASLARSDGPYPQVPWFGLQLRSGNSLIGARRESYPVRQLTCKANDDAIWLKNAPVRQPFGESLPEGQVWHFLLPDSGMAKYADKAVKQEEGAAIKAIGAWRRAFTKPFSREDAERLQRLSRRIDELWHEHARHLAKLRRRTADPYAIYGRPAHGQRTSLADKDRAVASELYAEYEKNVPAYRRLRLAMDYWCALWFWPIREHQQLPDREEFLFDLENLLLGDTILAGQPNETPDLFRESAMPDAGRRFVDRFGVVDLQLLFRNFPRLKRAQEIAQARRVFHWELEFADIFAERGGFDLTLGNPPWLKVEWEESGVLGDHQPLFALRKFSATQLRDLR